MVTDHHDLSVDSTRTCVHIGIEWTHKIYADKKNLSQNLSKMSTINIQAFVTMYNLSSSVFMTKTTSSVGKSTAPDSGPMNQIWYNIILGIDLEENIALGTDGYWNEI